ncbi:hypothetical protein PIB30_090314 [Stylosanthes scabra]|uniref:Uncharacterized protein n=1 Tax=Stylosanthes scabra TaxID=79078 RepID=A0ABU6QWN2_9FABA|nr:hypothetical protein [Stylosanthes scabra]
MLLTVTRDGAGVDVGTAAVVVELKKFFEGLRASPRAGVFLTALVITLGYARELDLRRHIFLLRLLRLGIPFKVLWTIVKLLDLNIGAVRGENSYSKRNQTIQQLEAALRELLERQTREAVIASEAVKRAEELAKRQQAQNSKVNGPHVEAIHCGAKCIRTRKKQAPVLISHPSEELPKKFSYPVEIEPYDGTTDPKYHLDAFENRMLLVNASDAI